MPIDVKEYQRLQNRIKELQTEAAKAQGAAEQLAADALAEFGVKTLKELRAKANELEQAAVTAEAAFEKAYAKFTKEWGDVLDAG